MMTSSGAHGDDVSGGGADNLLLHQDMSQTQTITVPLSIASQLISKQWPQAAETHL